uniref:Uncharacterized protein n=1 Tax=Pararge aegeria TaxID=116150 RepID=S4PNJ9_9NEOP
MFLFFCFSFNFFNSLLPIRRRFADFDFAFLIAFFLRSFLFFRASSSFSDTEEDIVDEERFRLRDFVFSFSIFCFLLLSSSSISDS